MRTKMYMMAVLFWFIIIWSLEVKANTIECIVGNTGNSIILDTSEYAKAIEYKFSFKGNPSILKIKDTTSFNIVEDYLESNKDGKNIIYFLKCTRK